MLSPDELSLAVRLVLNREPAGDEEISRLSKLASFKELRRVLLEILQRESPLLGESNLYKQYRAPLFLLAPPEPDIPWRLSPPDLIDPVSQLCTHGQVISDEYAKICAGLRVAPRPHRKQWEFVWIVAALRNAFNKLVKFRHVDMNNLPEDIQSFDACWSACALEHLGSLKHGLDFIRNSLNCLRPGGIAVHTTEFNLSSNEETFEKSRLSIYRKKDIVSLLSELQDEGHEVWPLNLHPGDKMLDEVIDLPPYSPLHLKLLLRDSFVTTSLGIAVRKRG